MTPEASIALQNYLNEREFDGERLTKESPLFRQSYQLGIQKAKFCHRSSLEWIIDRVVHNCGLRTIKDGKRKNIQLAHGFRKRFNTILKTTPGMNNNLAEKMMGHSVTIPLDNAYLDASIEMMFEEFKKAIPFLTISDEEREKLKVEKLQQENIKLEEKIAEIDNLKEQRRQDKIEQREIIRQVVTEMQKEDKK